MVERAGLEPTTFGVTEQHFNQLNLVLLSSTHGPVETNQSATAIRLVTDPQKNNLAERTGLEPATSGVTGQHSNQLNYRSTRRTC